MAYVIYNQQQKGNIGQKQGRQSMLSDRKAPPIRFYPGQIERGLRELPDKERLLLLLVDLRQYGVVKVAEIMNKPVNVVRKEVRFARALLKKKLLSYYQEDYLTGTEG
jgi:hypothetical protein